MLEQTNEMEERTVLKKDSDSLWRENPDLVRHFLEKRPDYEQLCTEVAYILKKRLNEHDIEVSTVTWRAKTLNSFFEKIQRKDYKNPFEEIKDFAGIRIVHLYKQDTQKIEQIIYNEFVVSEKVDKFSEKETDRFGYLATHFIATLGKKSLGARYEGFKNLSFEIQIRTVLQDAWAVIDHHLAYKKEEEVPKHLLRKLISVAAVFEMIDDNFDQIQQAIEKYTDELKSSQSNVDEFLQHDLDLTSFIEYLFWKFPLNLDDAWEKENWLLKRVFKFQAELIFDRIDKSKYPNLLTLDQQINRTEDIREKFFKERDTQNIGIYGPLIQVSLAIGAADKEFLHNKNVFQFLLATMRKNVDP